MRWGVLMLSFDGYRFRLLMILLLQRLTLWLVNFSIERVSSLYALSLRRIIVPMN